MVTLQRILCPIDFSESSRRALIYAKALSSWYDAPLTVLHVCVDLPVFESVSPFGHTASTAVAVEEAQLAARRAAVKTFVSRACGDYDLSIVVSEGSDASAEIVAKAGSDDGSLIVMGTHGRTGVNHLLLGSVTEAVLRRASCPVLVIPPHAPVDAVEPSRMFTRVLCAIDFSTPSLAALRWALEIAQEADAQLTLFHAIERSPALREAVFANEVDLDRLHAGADAQCLRWLRALVPDSAREFCTVATEVSEGKASREISRAAAERQADLIVMGVHGRNALGALVFGSNTNAVVRGAACPVLAVPAPRH